MTAPPALPPPSAAGNGNGLRGTKPEPPYLWVSKQALRAIRDGLDSDASASTGILTYVALAEVASDMEGATFVTTHLWLAQKTALSSRTIRRRIHDLAGLGLIRVETPRLKAPSTYHLLTIGHGVRTIGHSRNHASCPPSEGTNEGTENDMNDIESFQAKPEKTRANKFQPKNPGKPESYEEVEAFADTVGIDEEVVGKFIKHNNRKKWRGIKNWPGALVKFAEKIQTDAEEARY
jgi:hypothetical protein